MKDRRPHTKHRIGVMLVCIISVISLWLGLLPQASGSGTITTTNEVIIDFAYAKPEFTIRARASDGGVVTPEGDVLVKAGAGQRFAFTANSGYQIDEVRLDYETIWKRGENEDPNRIPVAYEFTRVVKDYTLEVVYTRVPTEPTTSPSTSPSVSPSGGVSPSPSVSPSVSPTASASVSASASATATATGTGGFLFPTPTPTRGGGGSGVRPSTIAPTGSSTPGVSDPPTPYPGGGGGSGVGDYQVPASAGNSGGASYQLTDADIPQSGIGANTLGDCFE